jgi:hypothetical protein
MRRREARGHRQRPGPVPQQPDAPTTRASLSGSATGMQCGLCALVAGLFRRAMCIAGSRRGSGESACYQELPPQPESQVRHREEAAHPEPGHSALASIAG